MEHCFLIKICENYVLTGPSSVLIMISRLLFLVFLSLLVYPVDSNVSVFIRRRSISPSQFVWCVVCKSVPVRYDRRSWLQFIDKLLLFTPVPTLVVGNVVMTLINGLIIVLDEHKM